MHLQPPPPEAYSYSICINDPVRTQILKIQDILSEGLRMDYKICRQSNRLAIRELDQLEVFL